MNKRIKLFYYFTIFIIFVFIVMLMLSSDFIRFKMINFYKKNGDDLKVIQIYNRILKKNTIKNKLSKRDISKIYIDLGYLYAKHNFMNLSIESYKNGAENFLFNAKFNFFKYDIKKDKLILIGLIEGRRWKLADSIIYKLVKIYYGYNYFEDLDKYIKIISYLRNQEFQDSDQNFYFALGDAYIKNELFEEAKSFFTKRILDYGVNLDEELNYLFEKYSKDEYVKQKVWKGEIYVSLDDFEKGENQLNAWVSTKLAKINSHYIDNKTAYTGYHSEWFDLTYLKEEQIGDYNYFTKVVNIPLSNLNFDIGVRLFIKNLVPSEYNFGVNISTQKYGLDTSGIFAVAKNKKLENGWSEYSIENLFENPSIKVFLKNSDHSKTRIDKILIDTKCISNKFFVDDIELYILNNENNRTYEK